MKNHIAIKFVAVLLCAASLLGAVGSGIGIFLMTEMDLYDKTVDQVYEERVQLNGRNLTQKLAMQYASTVLGGTPEAMLEQYFGYGDVISSSGFDAWYVGYSLKDAQGNELDSRILNEDGSFSTHTFAVTGQYMHFVDQTPEQEPQMPTEPVLNNPENSTIVQVDEIPPEGIAVYELQFSSPGSSSGASGGSLGTAFRDRDGCVILRCPGFYIEDLEPLVTSIRLYDVQGRLIYQAADEGGVGTMGYAEDGSEDLLFTAFYSRSGETPVPVPVTAPAEETVPATAAPEETAPEATTAETAAETTPETTTETTSETTAETTAETAAETASEGEAASGGEESSAGEDGAAAAAEDPGEGTEATEVTEAPTEPETVPQETVPDETVPQETVPEPVLINGRPLETYQINRTEYTDGGQRWQARFVYLPMPEITLELYLQPGALRSESRYTLMRIVQSFSGYLFPAMGICLLVFAITLVYLLCAAAKAPGTPEIRAGGLNRVPLDLYGSCVFGGMMLLVLAIAEGGDYLLRQNVTVGMAFIGGMGYLAALLTVGFLFACAAQFKTPGGFWWRNSLVGLCLRLCVWLLKKAAALCVALEAWLAGRGLPLLARLLRWCLSAVGTVLRWIGSSLKRFYRWLYSGLSHFYDLLPMTWQWILTGGVMVLFLLITFAGRYDLGIVLAVLFAFALVLYGAHCFGSLMEATRKMNRGDLNHKADDKLMIGAFKDFAQDLNDLADVAVVAAQKQLKSERMKTELITNVSHDIKTPLTSIINYVDLLQKPHTEQEQEQYLEVLERQSLRLKKLIDDLMDMSKASTGNMAVDITLLDAVESVNQALGEFGDKLERAQLTPVFRHTEDTVAMMADGKLVWRVLSNLLGNAVKYAMPGTRLYIDLMSLDSKVVISLKNISRDELNVDAEELMERFVRGDDARNTEGSGLGLNIAKSLMELQKGQLQLLVDGDLFKVTLIFPGI